MGGEKLKLSRLAMLFFGVWFFIQIPFVSSQEAAEQSGQPPVNTETEVAVRLRNAEQNIFLDTENTAAMQPVESLSVWVVIRMILALGLVAVAIYGVIFFIKRSAKQTPESNPFLKTLASAHLGSNRYAHIVAVGNKAWLLGSSDGGVNLIGEIDDKDMINAMLLEDSRKISQSPSNRLPDFLSILRRHGASSESRSSGADDIRKRRERLKDL